MSNPATRAVVSLLMGLALFTGVVLAVAPDSQASAALVIVPGREQVILAGAPIDAPSRPPATLPQSFSSQSVAITVEYVGFPADAKAAFQHAVDIWSTLITSTAPLRVQANWAPQGGNTLASAGSSSVSGFPNQPRANTLYPIPLANALAQEDLDPGQPHITARVNSSQANWYFGVDGNPPADKYDLVSVALHELLHGLAFTGSFSTTASSATASYAEGSGLPLIFDRFVVNGANESLLAFPNNSATLKAQLVSGNIFFSGPQTLAATANARAKLYAPNPWEQGSSVYHLDQDTYPAATGNSLMTPQLPPGVAESGPGPIALAMMRDMGWQTVQQGPAAPTATPTAVASPSPTATRTATPTVTVVSGGSSPTPTATRTAGSATFRAFVPAAGKNPAP